MRESIQSTHAYPSLGNSSIGQLACGLGRVVVCLVIGFASAMASAGTSNADDAHAKAAFLRAQPADEPAWFVTRADNSSMRISVLTQARYTISERDSGFIASGSEKTYGFSMPRTQVAFDGAIISSQFNYRVSFDFGDAELSRGRGNGPPLVGSTGSARLLDAYAQYNFSGKREGYYIKFGQFQSSLFTEEAIDSSRQLAIDRSMSSEIFAPGYTQGVVVGHVGEQFAWEASITDGGRYIGSRETDNTAFNSADEADFGFGFRADWKLKGSWDQFADFTSFQGSNSASKIGFGFLYQFQGQFNPGTQIPGFVGAPVESGQIVTWTVDYHLEEDGWNFFAAYSGQWVDWEFANATLATLHNGILLQGGYFITDRIEMYARLDTFWIDKAYRNGFSTPNGYIHRIGTLGVTRYILPESHAAKISVDVNYAFDALFALSVGGDSLGLPDPSVTGFLGLTNHEIVLRFQLQLLF